ncbi:MAG: hypothetical protein RLZZ245_3499 [Verrucomicrobiota bacterium]|jgi:hypothetical protein
MFVKPPSPRLSHLLSRLTDELLDPSEAEELDEILRRDPASRDHYRSHAAVHMELPEVLAEQDGLPVRPARRWSYRWILPVAALALITAGGLSWWRAYSRGSSLGKIKDASGETVLGVVSLANDVRWSLPSPAKPGQQLVRGTLKLFSGELTVTMGDGRLISLRGPAEMEMTSENAGSLHSGQAAFLMTRQQQRRPYIVYVPNGAVVDQGTEFSVNVAADGLATDVHVFEGHATASTLGKSGLSCEESQLGSGDTIRITTKLERSPATVDAFLRVIQTVPRKNSTGNAAYAKAVMSSSPAAYWRFERLNSERQVPDETGGQGLQLYENARLDGSDNQSYLAVNDHDAKGFASTRAGLPGLNAAGGRTIECLFYSTRERYCTIMAFELEGLAAPGIRIPYMTKHAPQSFLLERTRLKGEFMGLIHPDYSVRAMFRSPAGFVDGTNTYSRESHLLYQWVHVAVTYDDTAIRLYINGELSCEKKVALVFDDSQLRPIVGRLQSSPQGEQRQWIGAIDELALYRRALSPQEINSHYVALKE